MLDDTEIDLDSILNQIGGFGKYQIFYYVLLCVPIFFNSFATLSYVFTAGNLDYRCYIPECDQSSSNYNVPWFSNAIPQRTSGASSKCTFFALTRNVTSHEECIESIDIFDSSIEVTCIQYVYATDELTIVNEFDIHCEDNEWKLALVGTLNNIGLLVFMPFSGYLSDRFGRKRILIMAFMCTTVFGLLRSFSVNYYMFIITEFLEAGLGSITFTAIFILGMEILSPTKRVLGTIIITIVAASGSGVLGVIAMLTKNFRILLRIIYGPVFLFITYIWLVPESMRWLIIKRRYDEVIEILQKIAKVNKIVVPDDLFQPLRDQNNDEVIAADGSCVIEKRPVVPINDLTQGKGEDNLLVASKTPFLIIRIINCSFCWFTNTFVFYGLSLNSVSLAGDKYINFMLACFVDIPIAIVSYFILNRVSRKWCQSVTLILSGIACLASQIKIQITAINLLLFLIGKCAIAFSFTVLYVYTVELFPTSLRHTLMTICSMVGRIGSTLAPLTPLLSNYMSELPFILFGGTAILSGILALQFPDTLNKKLPDTLTEAKFLEQQMKQ